MTESEMIAAHKPTIKKKDTDYEELARLLGLPKSKARELKYTNSTAE